MTDTKHPGSDRFRVGSHSPEETLALADRAALVRWLRAIQSITDAALAHLTPDRLLDELLARVRGELEVDSARILLAEPSGDTLRLRAAAGMEHPEERTLAIPFGQGIAGWVAERRQAVIVDDISRVPVANPLMRRFHAAMVAPLVVEGAMIGVLEVGSVDPRRFSDTELGLLQMVADRTALAIDRARQYEEALVARQEAIGTDLRFRSLFENNPTAVFALDREGRFTSVNPATERISGYPASELLHQPFLPLLAEEERDITQDAFRAAVQGESRHLRTAIVDRRGRRIELQVTAVPIVIDGVVTGVFGIAQDVTQSIRHQAAQQELLEQLDLERSRIEAVLQQLPAGVLIAEAPSGRLIMGNQRVRQILRHDVVPFADLRSIAWVGAHADGSPLQPGKWPLARAIAGERITGEEILLNRADGTSCWIRVNAAPIRNAHGDIVAGVAVFHDVDSERRAGDAMRFLADASGVLHASLDHQTTMRQIARLAVPRLADWCAVDLLDPKGNPRRQEIAHQDPGREALAVPSRSPSLFRFDAPDQPFGEVLRTGEPMLIHEVPDDLPDGLAESPREAELIRGLGMRSAMIVPLRARGRNLGVITFVAAESWRLYTGEDLALAQEVAHRSAIAIENAQLYEEAFAADQAKSDFLAVMSHELRTPLAAIMGYTELLQMGIPETVPDAALRQVERIEAAARHQLSLVDEILTFSRLTANQETVEWSVVDVARPIEEAAAFVRPLAEKKELTLRVDVPGAPVPVRTDAAKLRQALGNLLFNAVQFTREGEVFLRVETDAEEVRISLRDTGIGIAPEHHEKIFDPFWQVRQDITREVGGTGLGLTVSRRLVRLLGGEVTVRSALHEGSEFTVHLPHPRDAAPAAG